MRLYVNTATWITGMKIQTAHGRESKHGVKTLGIYYLESRHHWKLNEKIVLKMYSTDDWEEIPKDSDQNDNKITLNKMTTAPILFKFEPILTDQIFIYFFESQEPNQDIFINELELHNDCKLKLAHWSNFVIFLF